MGFVGRQVKVLRSFALLCIATLASAATKEKKDKTNNLKEDKMLIDSF